MWSKDPIKLAVLRAILSCEISVRLTDFRWDMGMALSQKVCFLHLFHWKWRECITEMYSATHQYSN